MSQNSGGQPGHPPRVLIVGGGIGGLCLAQGLRKSGIAVTLFERDQSAAAGRQGYGFHINSDGSQALHECLPRHLFDLYLATSSQPAEGTFALYNSRLQQLFARPLPKSGDDPSRVSTASGQGTRGSWWITTWPAGDRARPRRELR